MLAHDLKRILELVPDAMPLIKHASVEEDFPVDSADSTLASGLRINYLLKVAHKPVDCETITLVKKASQLWNVQNDIDKLSTAFSELRIVGDMKKEASERHALFLEKITGYSPDLPGLAKEAQVMLDKYKEHIDSEEVLRYSCQGVLNKQAALDGLNSRKYHTGNEAFSKLASSLADTDTNKLSVTELQKLAEVVTGLDKKAGLHFKGFNFYREAIMVKEADIKGSMTILIDGKDVPYEKIQRLGKERIAGALGKEFSTELGKGPVQDKEVLETLPIDLQKILSKMLSNV